MARKVIDRGFDLDKTSNKYLVQVLNYRKKLEDRIKGWKILVAVRRFGHFTVRLKTQHFLI